MQEPLLHNSVTTEDEKSMGIYNHVTCNGILGKQQPYILCCAHLIRKGLKYSDHLVIV